MYKDVKVKTKISKKIGDSIKFYRKKNNISQESLAYNIGVDRTYISALEQGSKLASVYCLFLISKELNIELKDLLDIKL